MACKQLGTRHCYGRVWDTPFLLRVSSNALFSESLKGLWYMVRDTLFSIKLTVEKHSVHFS